MRTVPWLRSALILPVLFGVTLAARAEEQQPPDEKKPTEIPKVEVTAPPAAAAPEMSREQMELRMGRIPWDSDRITSDSQRVGSYNQPQWTTQRPFSTTRTYVLPEGTMEFEQWFIPTFPTTGKGRSRQLEELTVGLPYHLQLDVYARWDIDNSGENNKEVWRYEADQIEMRWALANWDVIPLNPTIYMEWIQRGHNGESDKYEFKLLLGDSFFHDKLFWSMNFSFEKEIGQAKEDEIQISQAFGTTIIERKLMAGIEMYYQNNSFQDTRGTPSNTFVIGPSLQWRPTNRTFVDLVGMVGLLGGKTPVQESLRGQVFLIIGYQFGHRAGPSNEIYAPAAARSGL
jgi:hypothetical protein